MANSNAETGTIPHWVSFIGRVSRRAPYFRGKWRVVDFIFRRFQQRATVSEVVHIDRNLTIQCNLWDEVQNNIWWLGTGYECVETQFLLRTLKEKSSFVDVGANVGYYTLIASRRVGDHGCVHAFEPVSAQFDALTANVRRNCLRNVVLNKLIVADSSGPKLIHLGSENNTGEASVVQSVGGEERNETVESITLDQYLLGKTVDAIKIDTEGYELSVLRGAARTLGHSKPLVLVEVKDRLLRAAGSDRNQLFAFLRAFGYKAFGIRRNGTLAELSAPVDGKLIVFK
jgi:FkbM family methyltransferase